MKHRKTQDNILEDIGCTAMCFTVSFILGFFEGYYLF